MRGSRRLGAGLVSLRPAPEASKEPAAEQPASVDPVIVISMSAETAAEAVEPPAPESSAKPVKKPRAKKATPEVAEAPAEEALAKPAKKPRGKKTVEPAPEAVAETPKPAKKSRAKKTKE